MELTLRRRDANEQRTIGQLFVNGVGGLYTLEPPTHALAPECVHPAIPAGRYRVIITESHRFGRPLPLVVGVPGREGIRFHPGNIAANTEGCVLVGLERSTDDVLQSRAAMEQLQPQIQKALDANEEVFVTVADVPAAERTS